MQRKCKYLPLSKQPLVLVICQVSYSPIRSIANYIPAIQEEFRRNGFPIEKTGKVQEVTFVAGSTPMQVAERELWEYRRKDETWSIIVQQNSITLQTTTYERFEEFVEYFKLAVNTVLQKTEHDQFGVRHQMGLRYIDQILPQSDKNYRYYLRPGLHGITDNIFSPTTHRAYYESIGNTDINSSQGTMVIRVAQNNQGYDFPPDLMGSVPKYTPRTKKDSLVTLIDMDHLIKENCDLSVELMVKQLFEMHDHIINIFHEHVVTEEAIEEWQ